ncbi:MAG: flagellar biosynthesis protein FlhB [Deltaproteobacteria bacterium]|nr:flagellar biosynthesis protein FlhB [Deltaproteobacteria bacterium]
MPWQEERDQRTESASPRRRQEARDKGQVARSNDVASTVVLFSGLMVFYFFGARMLDSLKGIMGRFLLNSGSFNLTEQGLVIMFRDTVIDAAYLLIPLVIFPAAGILANIMQVGVLFTAEPLTPNLSRINPLEGIKRLVSIRALVELVKGILKLIVIGYISYIVIRNEMPAFSSLADMSITGIIYYLGSGSFKILIMTSSLLIVVAAVDYAFQRWDMEKSLRMTKQEVKEEFKETEGQPLIKSRIKSLQREMARTRMMQEVPKATIVITNPTHLAVALKYEQGRMRAPNVVAKGSGFIAEKIKEIARKHSVPVIENKPLAQVLWKSVEIGKEIPSSLYRAVAEVLAYIYRLKAKGMVGTAHPTGLLR